jgi:lipopolysaccharide export LptBFGC system permease protein LptF
MKNLFFYVLLLLLVVLDGWLMAHPNLIGRAGIFFYDYTYLKTFPRALATVAAVVGLAVLLAWVAKRAGRSVGLALLIALFLLAGYWFVNSLLQFNSGVYKLTGAGFRAGAILLPGLVVLVFGNGLYEQLTTKR